MPRRRYQAGFSHLSPEDSAGAETVRELGSLKVEADVWECLRSHLGGYLKSSVLRILGSPNIQGPGQNSAGMSRR